MFAEQIVDEPLFLGGVLSGRILVAVTVFGEVWVVALLLPLKQSVCAIVGLVHDLFLVWRVVDAKFRDKAVQVVHLGTVEGIVTVQRLY